MVLALSAFALEAQQGTPPPAFEAIRLAEPPSLEWFVAASDGPLREPGAAITDLRQRAPGDGTPVSQSTTAFLSYDEDHLYVVFVCKDTPAAIRANISRREDIGDDDAVAIHLDTFRDRQRAYVLIFLLTYLINPGTFLYLGYIDHYEDVEIDAGNRFGLRRVGRRTTSVGRQAFAKVSYSWRL
jgi:hypothetical protein